MKTHVAQLLKRERAAASAPAAPPSGRLCADDRGAITIVAALALPMMIGMVALAVEFGNGLLIRDETQRVSDEAAFAGAFAYLATGQQSSILSAAQNIAALNNVPAQAVTASLLASSPRDATSQAVQVDIAANEAILLGQVLGFRSSVTIQATSYAEIPAGVTSCILALSASGSGVSLSGGTSISAPNCAVASQASIAVPCGDAIRAKDVYYNGSAPTVGCPGGIVGPVKKASSADPLANNPAVVAANARAVADESLTSPTIPSVTKGTNIVFDWSNQAVAEAHSANCSATFSSRTWTVVCPSGGAYNFGSLSVAGGINVQFNVSGSAATSYTFSGTVTNGGSTLTFGPGTFTMAGGLVTGGGSTTSFGAGAFNIGAGPSCSGASYSICHTGSTLTFGGPGAFVLTSGVYNSGGETIIFGAGLSNSYAIGAASNGDAFNVGGGSTTTFADATGSNSMFEMVGNVTESGGSCITLPAATNHDINGNVTLAGGLRLGAGLYAVTGSFLIGASGGGDVWCANANANVGVSGANVTIAVAGLGAGSRSNVFVIGAGFNHMTLSAPTSGTYDNVAIVGPLSTSVTKGMLLTEGASATAVGGALYFPNGPMTLSGGASIGAGTGACLEIVASEITLSGGTSISAAQCFAASSGQGTPFLVE
jgi:Flp pilus assembly protein TadG